MIYFIIIRGPLGGGKSTIAKTLAQHLKAVYINIDKILEENKLDDIDQKIQCIPIQNFAKAIEIIIPFARKNLDEGKIVIFDACFYHKESIDHLIYRLPYKNFVFNLKTPLKICIERDKNRVKNYGKSAVMQVYNLVSKFDYGIIIDTSKPIEKAIEEIISNLPKN